MRSAPINLRALPSQRDLIDQAAALLGKTRSDFMLEVACKEAQNVILDRTVFSVSEEQYNQFLQILEEPAQYNPGLERLFAKKAPWEQE
ncbi:uncharacterized protein (DUF1778 family) [Cricetibacter osteomyelitidis]|uniref:Uncharacterized protein (DUF1778 family) n=1 Tax=Cricetibacter osteomyelitidis TaxID=1521931 RepID=A0A4R2T1X0_9PAST|nr:DUF1778 domain-containing protein [Cricetibacter osteomyelitidis]TCP95945.1 uncharacterized protein (DUF1778 family) [Cricetibacter osteomyelitidis]